MNVIGWDIGGANVKAADTEGNCRTRSFPIWRDPQRLPDVLTGILGVLGPPERDREAADVFAVTMTAELADCFQTKAEGVAFVLQAMEQVAGDAEVHVWQTGAEFVTPDVACDVPLLVAAANWHALATFAGRLAPQGTSLLIDVGTTTTDIIPLRNGVPVPDGLTDAERLRSGELVYSGVERTPLCAVAHSVPLPSGYCPLAAELFATTLDVHLLLGNVPEDAASRRTANGQPATKPAAHDRLARLLCCDRTELSAEEAVDVARFLADVQRQRIAGALQRICHRWEHGHFETVLVSGAGSFLARQIIDENPLTQPATVIPLAECFTPEVSEAACAFAVAKLAAERVFVNA